MKLSFLHSLALFSSGILFCDGFSPASLQDMPSKGKSRYDVSSSSNKRLALPVVRRFQTKTLQMSIPNSLDTLTSGLASISRLPFGTIVSLPITTSSTTSSSDDTAQITADNSGTVAAPLQILRLYDMEGNSDCRLVRERITELDLCVDVVIPAGRRSRALNDSSYEYYIDETAGKSGAMIPRMMISEEGGDQGVKILVGSEEILNYLTDKFGPRNPIVDDNDDEIKKKVVEALVLFSEPLPSLWRLGRGQDVAGCALSQDTPRPVKPLVSFMMVWLLLRLVVCFFFY